MPITYTVERCVPAHHPSLAGHFPGDPIVPGVVLLDEVLDAFTVWQGPCHLRGITTVKFLKPLAPNRTFRIGFALNNPESVGFRCTRDNELLAQGQLIVTRL